MVRRATVGGVIRRRCIVVVLASGLTEVLGRVCVLVVWSCRFGVVRGCFVAVVGVARIRLVAVVGVVRSRFVDEGFSTFSGSTGTGVFVRRPGGGVSSNPTRQSQPIHTVELIRQESRAVARKPRDAPAVLFGLKFAADDDIHYKFKSSQASKARLQSSKHTGTKQNLTQNGDSRSVKVTCFGVGGKAIRH